jgi:arsenite methyltransferase
MISPDALKQIVKEKYAEIAEQSRDENASSCCGATSSCCGDGMSYTIMADDYIGTDGYIAEADLGLGCGIPTAFAGIQPGMIVLDLGSGAGNDVFIAAREVGPEGRVIGVDMTQAMIDKANSNKEKIGATNVEFRFGDIEQLPVDDATVDVIVSNCVLNLVPDKAKAFAEMYRVLKPGGHFAVSDIVFEGSMPEALKTVAELYAGCVSGAIQKSEYLALIREAGFGQVDIPKEKEIMIPESILHDVSAALPEEHRTLSGARLASVTVTGVKGA